MNPTIGLCILILALVAVFCTIGLARRAESYIESAADDIEQCAEPESMSEALDVQITITARCGSVAKSYAEAYRIEEALSLGDIVPRGSSFSYRFDGPDAVSVTLAYQSPEQ